jgi:DNA topoisomerase-2
MKIKSIKKNILESPNRFYDITVPKYENFVIGKSNIVVHNSSMDGAIIGMAQTFKNSMPLFDGIGQFGSLRSTEPGAARYVSVKLNANFRTLYKDFDLLKYKIEEDLEIEPNWFLPIIPVILLNGTSGIAVGFATNILNRNVNDVIDACLLALDGKKFKEPLPWWSEYTGEIIKVDNDTSTFELKGKYEIVNTSTVKVTELPPSLTYQKYEAHLNNLEEKGHILYYDNNCKKSKIEYIIKFNRNELQTRQKKNQLDWLLKMTETETENITCLDEHNKIIKFDSATALINYFINFRLTFYDKRKQYKLDELDYDHKVLTNKAEFIKLVITGKLKINNRPKIDIITDLELTKIEKINDSFDYLLNLPIYNLTKEKYEDLLNNIKENRNQFAEIQKLTATEMYKSDLIELKKKIKSSK